MPKLTLRALQRLANAPGRHPDGDGLSLRVIDADRRYWGYRYRLGGKETEISLGRYPQMGLDEARRLHAKARAEGSRDHPRAAKKLARKAKAAVTAHVAAPHEADLRRDGRPVHRHPRGGMARSGTSPAMGVEPARLLRVHPGRARRSDRHASGAGLPEADLDPEAGNRIAGARPHRVDPQRRAGARPHRREQGQPCTLARPSRPASAQATGAVARQPCGAALRRRSSLHDEAQGPPGAAAKALALRSSPRLDAAKPSARAGTRSTSTARHGRSRRTA